MQTYAEIESLWDNGQKETLNLEYKADVSLNSDEIAKDISSFANSEGGVIIYGLSEDSTKGTAIKSSGIVLKKKDERIQQIVSSSIAPELQIRIDIIQALDELTLKPLTDMGFIVVKIPKSEMYIHQVTTTSKYYVRNNTQVTQYKFDPQELKESDIEYRYRRRFENKTRIERSFDHKKNDLVSEFNWPCHLFLGALPNAITSKNRTIDKILFRRALFTKPDLEDESILSSSDFRYRTLCDYDIYKLNKPTINGRVGTFRNKTMTIEMNNDGSVYVFQHLPEDRPFSLWEHCIYGAFEFMHMIKRLYSELNLYGGVTIRFALRSKFDTDRERNIIASSLYEFGSVGSILNTPSGNYVIKEFNIDEHFQFVDYDLKSESMRFLQQFFNALGIEDINKKFPSFVKNITNFVNNLEV